MRRCSSTALSAGLVAGCRWALVFLLAVYLLLVILAESISSARLQRFQHDPSSVVTVVLAFVALAAIAFWPYASRFLQSRNIVVGKDSIELTAITAPGSTLAGTVRDNFIYLGNFYLRTLKYDAAYEHYASAHRLSRSILTSVRCMQSLAARMRSGVSIAQDLAPMLTMHYEEALWLADGPREELEGRMGLAEWVRRRRHLIGTPQYVDVLRKDLMELLDADVSPLTLTVQPV